MPTQSRVLGIIRNVLLIVAGLAAIFFFIVIPWFFTSVITHRQFHYMDPNDGKTPKSYNMDFQWVEFKSLDGITLRGWYIPAESPARGTIIYCHGLNRTRIEMLPDATFGHSLGYNGLLFDFRHQGMSDGKITTLGYQERLDVEGAVRFALAQERAARPIVAWGVSMGAAAALLATADSPDIAGVISDSSFDSFMGTLRHHLRLFLHLRDSPSPMKWVIGRRGAAAFVPAISIWSEPWNASAPGPYFSLPWRATGVCRPASRRSFMTTRKAL